jgi:glycosyltransferase involved in cell wall biosynthesis
MRRILFVAPDLEYTGAGKQMALLAAGLPRDEVDLRVCVLSDEGPLAPALRSAGVRVQSLGWTRRLDLLAPWRLRRLVEDYRPDVIHAWRPAALRAVAAAAGRRERSLVLSHPVPPRRGLALGRLDRWLLGRAERVVAAGPAEAERCRRLGIPGAKLTVVPPGVATVVRDQGPVTTTRLLLCAGPLEPHKGFRDAIWAFDVLRRIFPGLHLVLAGTGTDRPRLERFTQCIGLNHLVHFVGRQPELAGLMAQAEVIWIPSRAEAGVNVALEAMAAGRPVVASRLPGLAEVVADGETGLLVSPGDKVALARQTRQLLDDDSRRRALGAAGRRRMREHFAAGELVRRFAGLYRELSD